MSVGFQFHRPLTPPAHPVPVAVAHPFAVAADDGEAQVSLRHRLVGPAGHVGVPVQHALAQVPAADAAGKV